MHTNYAGDDVRQKEEEAPEGPNQANVHSCTRAAQGKKEKEREKVKLSALSKLTVLQSTDSRLITVVMLVFIHRLCSTYGQRDEEGRDDAEEDKQTAAGHERMHVLT